MRTVRVGTFNRQIASGGNPIFRFQKKNGTPQTRDAERRRQQELARFLLKAVVDEFAGLILVLLL